MSGIYGFHSCGGDFGAGSGYGSKALHSRKPKKGIRSVEPSQPLRVLGLRA